MAVVRAVYCAFLSCSIVILFTVNCNCFNEQINDDHDDDSIKRCTTIEVEGIKPRGRPRKTWWDGIKDMKIFGTGMSRERVLSETMEKGD